MGEVVAKCGITKESGYLYFVDGNGNVSCAPMSRAGRTSAKMSKKVVKETRIKKEPGYLYYINKDGDVCRSKMARGKKK